MPVNQPIDFAILSGPSTKAEQLIVGTSTHAIQHGNLLLRNFTIGLKVFQVINAHCSATGCAGGTGTKQADTHNAYSKF
jgi:hypothetical protein